MTIQDRRLELHELLKSIMTNGNVYHQPPENIKLKYPCIVYERSRDFSMHADNKKYMKKLQYTITLIDKKSLSDYFEAILDLPYCSFDRHFTSDDLNHDVFTIYY